MTVDAERSAVYAAELEAFDGTDIETVRPFQDIDSLIRLVVGGSWWPGPSVSVAPARRDATSSSARRCDATSDATRIRVAADQATVATAAHELAHALAGPERGHDAVFRSAFLDVVAVITNLSSLDRRLDLHVDQLRSAFADVGLAVAQRRWRAPGTAGPIEL